jgi:hypothetical protein
MDETYSRLKILERCIFMQIENRCNIIYLDNPLPSNREDEDRLYDLIQRVRLPADELSGASSCRSKTAKTIAQITPRLLVGRLRTSYVTCCEHD